MSTPILTEILIDANRYKFLRDFYAMDADDDKAEFAKLARLTGKEFDAAVDAAIAKKVAA
jgi:hypothetical protein